MLYINVYIYLTSPFLCSPFSNIPDIANSAHSREHQSYNHHYSPNIISLAAKLRLDHNGLPMGIDHGHMKTLLFDPQADDGSIPPDAQLNSGFVHGNGQEHRQVPYPSSLRKLLIFPCLLFRSSYSVLLFLNAKARFSTVRAKVM